MSQELPDETRWLTLSEAAKQLNVHASTLRRWADEGQIPFMLTPGGHRRFAASDISLFATRHHGLRPPGPIERIWANLALERTREEIAAHPQDEWLSQDHPDTRTSNRLLGQQLVELIFLCLTSEREPEAFVNDARSIGLQYGLNAKKLDLPLTKALKISMFFRDTLVATAINLPKNIRITEESQRLMLKRINTMLNTVQLGIVEIYESSEP